MKIWLSSKIEEKGYKTRAIDTILTKYSSKDNHLFTITDNTIYLNKSELSKIDLKTIGLRGKKKKYSKAVVSLAINELHKRDNGKMWLTELVPMVLSSIAPEPTLSRKGVLDILESDWSDDIIVFRINNRIGIRLRKQFVAAPNFKTISEPAQETDLPHMAEDKETRERITAATVLDWDKLILRMKRELKYYISQSWFGMDFDLEASLMLFKSLMTSSSNTNLSSIIPQNLYAYWFCATDEYDRNRYFCDLARCYEALLKEIYYSERTAPMKKVKGLNDMTMFYFPTIYEALNSPVSTYGFSRIVKDLSIKRNKLAHGDYIELSSVVEAQTITNYVALYVYTIATKGVIKKKTNRN